MIKKFKISNIDKWLKQNSADVVDFIEGSLLDNLLAYSNKAVIAILETYLNSNASYYTGYYAKAGTLEANEIEELFYSRCSEE